MKFLIVFGLTIAITSALTLTRHQNDSKWQQFKSAHQKVYKTPEEEQKRYELFLQKLEQVNKHNEKHEQGLTSYRKGINQFSDWTPEELAIHFNENEHEEITNHKTFYAEEKSPLPDSVDWRKKGAVSRVKDEGRDCNSGWSFSVTGALEGIMEIQQKRGQSLSEQNLIDCSVPKDVDGCKGSSREGAFQYVVKNGIESELDYKYTQVVGKCKFDIYKSILAIEDYKAVAKEDENALKAAVANQPVSISLTTSGSYFADYESGIFDEDCNNEQPVLHRALLIVGYGSENGKDFWIIKNSWGVGWGEMGYIRIIRNRNICGIVSKALFPVGAKVTIASPRLNSLKN